MNYAEAYQKHSDRLHIKPSVPTEKPSPLSWIALLGATLLVAVVLVWSFTAYIPDTITAAGAVSAKHQTNTLYSDVLGQVNRYTVQQGDTIAPGQVVCNVKTASGELVEVKSVQAGTVARLLVDNGDYIGEKTESGETTGKALIRIDPDTMIQSPQVVVFYVPQRMAGKIEVGMETQISLTAQKSQTYGHMWGRVTNIDGYASTSADIVRLHGSELGVKMEEEPVAVTCEILCDADTVSGYWWSNPKGKSLDVSNGDRCNVKVIVKQIHPIEKFLTKLREIWEGSL